MAHQTFNPNLFKALGQKPQIPPPPGTMKRSRPASREPSPSRPPHDLNLRSPTMETTISAANVKEPLPSTADVKHDMFHLDRTISIKVSGGHIFDIHRGILKFYSGYFRSAIKNIEEGKFAESASGIIGIPDEEPEISKLFLRWLYAPGRKLTEYAGPDYAMISWLPLCKLWALDERRIIPALQNRVMDLIISKMSMEKTMRLQVLGYAFEHTSSNSPLRRIMVYYHSLGSYLINDQKDKDLQTNLSWFEEFSKMVITARMDNPSPPQKFGWDRCVYHVHGKGIQCEEKGWKTYC